MRTKSESAQKTYKEYIRIRKVLGLPIFNTSNPDYVTGQELLYSRKMAEEWWSPRPPGGVYRV